MANPVICEQYIINSNIEKHLQKAITSTEHLLSKWIPRRESPRYNSYPLRCSIFFEWCLSMSILILGSSMSAEFSFTSSKSGKKQLRFHKNKTEKK